MDQIFFRELGLEPAKYNLNIGSGSQGNQTGRMLIGIEKVLQNDRPDLVIVQGDTNSTMAGALAAAKLGISVAHIEAGLRSYDRNMPEEYNRIIADHISNFLFCPTSLQKEILKKENIDSKQIFVVGNTIVDAVNQCLKIAQRQSNILKQHHLIPDNYFLLTCHRPSNTDLPLNFQAIIKAVTRLCRQEKIPCLFPVHPRLKQQLSFLQTQPELIITQPLGYLDLLLLQKNSKMIFTDSGGIQEEACILQKKCLILRTNTERPETVRVGGSVLLKKIAITEIINQYQHLLNKKVNWKNPFGTNPTKKIFSHLF